MIKLRRMGVACMVYKYYGAMPSRRGIIGGNGLCVYYNKENGNTCAVGLQCEPDEVSGLIGPVEDVFDKLPEHVRELGLEFQKALQKYHDHPNHWTESSMTKDGRDYFKSEVLPLCAGPIFNEEPKTQLDCVIWHLVHMGELCSWQAIQEYGITRLAEYIRVLRHEQGWTIYDRWESRENRFGKRVGVKHYSITPPKSSQKSESPDRDNDN